MLGRDYLYHYLNIPSARGNKHRMINLSWCLQFFLLQIPFLTSELQAAMSFRIISKRKCFFFISYSAENIQTFANRMSDSSTLDHWVEINIMPSIKVHSSFPFSFTYTHYTAMLQCWSGLWLTERSILENVHSVFTGLRLTKPFLMTCYKDIFLFSTQWSDRKT